MRDFATITATVSKPDLIQGMCPGAPAGAERLARGPRGTISKPFRLQIRWHVERVLRLRLTYGYDLRFAYTFEGDADSTGKDEFDGVLAEQEDGTWEGALFAKAKGKGGGMFFGLPEDCTPEWNATQMLEVFGEPSLGVLPGKGPDDPPGNFHLVFYPLTPVRPAYGTSICPGMFRPGSRYDYAPFADARIFDTNVGLTLEFPTQDLTFETYDIPDSTNVFIDASWKVIMEMLKPPPLPS